MKANKRDIRWFVSVALMVALIIVWASTYGMIPLPFIKATTVHILVIIGAILLGPLAGGILGFTFGMCSMIRNTIEFSTMSFAFSPFLSTTGLPGALKAIWISVGCRVMIGVVSGWLWILFKKLKMNQKFKQIVALAITGFVGSAVNTILVMGSIYLLLTPQYAEAKNVAITAVWGLVMGTVVTSGIPEAIVAIVLVPLITKVLLKIQISNRN